jgi:hypothetical protein
VKTYYKSHEIEINKQPNGDVIYDVFARGRQHVLAGFSLSGTEVQFLTEMKIRVDKMVSEAPVTFRP